VLQAVNYHQGSTVSPAAPYSIENGGYKCGHPYYVTLMRLLGG